MFRYLLSLFNIVEIYRTCKLAISPPPAGIALTKADWRLVEYALWIFMIGCSFPVLEITLSLSKFSVGSAPILSLIGFVATRGMAVLSLIGIILMMMVGWFLMWVFSFVVPFMKGLVAYIAFLLYGFFLACQIWCLIEILIGARTAYSWAGGIHVYCMVVSFSQILARCHRAPHDVCVTEDL